MRMIKCTVEALLPKGMYNATLYYFNDPKMSIERI
jgi:hypothetical protein